MARSSAAIPRQESIGIEAGIAVFLVRLSVERVDDAYIPRFSVLSRPNLWPAAVAVAETGRFATVEDFVAAAGEDVRPAVAQVVQEWTQQPQASIRFNKIGVSLDVRNPFKPQGGVTSVFVWTPPGCSRSIASVELAQRYRASGHFGRPSSTPW